jgi:fatty-acyl-CoA synthase
MTTFSQRLKSHYTQTPHLNIINLQRAGHPYISITYHKLLAGASGFTHALEHEGIQPGEVVVLILQHSEELIYSFFGAILQGAIPAIMPFLTEKLSPDRYRADLGSLISVTRPSAVVTYEEFEGDVRSALQNDNPVHAILLAGKIKPDVEIKFESMAGFQCKSEELVLLQHSSGTTGLQKGVALSHQAVFNQLEAYIQAIELNKKDVIVSWLPLYHDMGLIAGFLMPILTGIPLVLMSPFDWVRAPVRLLQAGSRFHGTLAWLPNFAFNFCAQKIRDRDLEGIDLSNWRAIINCSEPVRWESHQEFYERFKSHGLRMEALQTSYAMAENVFGVTQSDLRNQPKVEQIDRKAFMVDRVARQAAPGKPTMKMMSSGRTLANTRLRVLDENGKEVPERTIGEMAIQSNCILSGYYNRPDVTGKAFINGCI